MHVALSLACAALLAGCATAVTRPVELMPPGSLEKLPARPADHRILYGDHPSQFGDLRLPRAKGPHAVVVLIHGGCWKSQYASLRDLAALADAFKREGIATWNIEYRRLGEAGGGWPGTYRDRAAAIDHLRSLAGPYGLDLSRIVVLGHSAGGHLAHWAGVRARLSSTSVLYMPDPLSVRGVINLAGRMDMAEAIQPYETLCRDSVIHQLLGGAPATVPDRYRDASPIRHLPLKVPQVLIWGDREDFVPAPLAETFAAAAMRAGDDVELITVRDAGHFETANPHSAAWRIVLSAVQRVLSHGRTDRRP